MNTKKHLGSILVELGLVPEETIRRALAFQEKKAKENSGKKPTLGSILVHNGLISKEQLDRALKSQRESVSGIRVIRSQGELEIEFGELFPKISDRKTNEPFVEPSAVKHILVVENIDGLPFVLHTEEAKTVLVNAYIKTQERLEDSYRDSESRPRPVLVTPDVIELFGDQANDGDEGDDKTDAEKTFEEILRIGYELNASDVHFFRGEEKCRIRFRIFGNMRDHTEWKAEKADKVISVGFTSFGSGDKNPHWKQTVKQRTRLRLEYSENVTLNGRYEHSPGDDGAYHVCIRLMPNDRRDKNKLIDFEVLGFTRAQSKLLKASASKSSGLVCFAGPTGSGKSTTLAGLVKWLNRDDDQNILTVESPIERPLPAFQTSVSDDDDANPKEFGDAIKSTLRRNPDALMVGEIRDHYSAEAAVSGVQTGHMLLTSIHAQSAIEIVDRMCSTALKVPTQTIGSPSFISALVFQMLLPRLDDKSKIRITSTNARDYLSSDLVHRLYQVVPNIDKANLCIRGQSSEYPEGISGMTICAEVMAPDMMMRSHFRKLELTEALMHWQEMGRKQGTKQLHDRVVGFTAHDHAIQKMIAGLIDPRDVEAYFGLLSMPQVMSDGMFEEAESVALFTDDDQPPLNADEHFDFSATESTES